MSATEGVQDALQEVVTAERPKSAKATVAETFAVDERAPMLLIPLAAFRSFGRIPRSSDRAALGVLAYEDLNDRASSLVVFVSHRWLTVTNEHGKLHMDPDVASRDKYKTLVEGLERLLRGLDASEVYIWIDFCCIEQDDRELCAIGVRNLPGYISRSDMLYTPFVESLSTGELSQQAQEFVDRFGDESGFGLFKRFTSLAQYTSRGWCRLEMFLGSNSPMPKPGFEYFRRVNVNRSDRPHLLFGDHHMERNEVGDVGPRIADGVFQQLHPAHGNVTVEEVRVALNAIVGLFNVNFRVEDEYDGETDDEGKPHGNGKMVYATGAMYEGGWKHGVYEGEGTFLYPNGTVYKGGMRNGVRHGYGEHFLSNGLKFVGHFADGDSHGPGRLYYQSGRLKFRGTKNRTEWTGPLEEFYANGRLRYKGNSLHNYWHGLGTEYDETSGAVLRYGYWENGAFVREAPAYMRCCMS